MKEYEKDYTEQQREDIRVDIIEMRGYRNKVYKRAEIQMNEINCIE